MSTGMDVRSAQTATTDLATPEGLAATAGDRDGERDLHWDKVNNARSYVIERSPDPITATSWAHAAVATKSQATIGGLTSGTKYWFRVAAINPNGQSGWSNPAMKTAH
jgi:predicted phage tail protein